MEDVIFAGTRDRKSVGLASVTMVLADPNGEHAFHRDTEVKPAGHPAVKCEKSSRDAISRSATRLSSRWTFRVLHSRSQAKTDGLSQDRAGAGMAASTVAANASR
jgi:hypothetical protein